ncbi:hypothetical protein MRX96_041839 [Rhipicephalus microplus]
MNAHEALKKGLFKDSDVLLGVNKDEGSIFVANTLPYIFLNGLAPNITKDEAAFYLIFFFQYIIRTGTRDIRDHYFKNIKDRDYPSVRNAFIEAIGDYLQICPTIYYGEVYSEFNNSVYFYHFLHRPSNSYWPEWLEADLGELIERYWYDVRFNVFIDGRESTTYCVSPEQSPTVRLQQLSLVDITKGHYELKYEVRDWKAPPATVRKDITCIGYVIDEDEEFSYKD